MNQLLIKSLSSVVFSSAFFQSALSTEPHKTNVLFIVADDLRPELNCYGKSQIISPNIDKLASQGIVFKNAYCNVPVSGASRASFLTSLYPGRKRFLEYNTRVDIDAPGVITLPQNFKNNGFHTIAIGKIFHHPDDKMNSWTDNYRPDYPNELSQQELWRDYQAPDNTWTKLKDLPLGAAGPAWEAADVNDSIYYDGKTTKLVLSKLNELAKSEKPFFLGVGFIRPHLPFNAPKKYWDLYNNEDIQLADNPYMPLNAPAEAWHNSMELRAYANIAKDSMPIPDEKARKLRHGYYACVSYIDAQIGLIIDRLKELGLYENTVIVLIGDHGFSLGEHSLWCKHSCFDVAMKTPLIIKAPGIKKGMKSESLTSLIDIYPTLCDLASVPTPEHVEGKSLLPILKNKNAKPNKYVFCRFLNGESVISNRYIYTEYIDKSGNVKSSMLYDHKNDPNENHNIVNLLSKTKVKTELKSILDNHIKTKGNQ